MSKSLFQDEAGLCNDLSFLAHLPELCDITFMVFDQHPDQDQHHYHFYLLIIGGAG